MSRAFKQFFFVVLGGFSLMILVHAKDQSGFISIDCGGAQNSSYTEETTGLTYISDADFIDTGETKLVLPKYGNEEQLPYRSLRRFPQGTRNCYTLNLTSNSKYLIRATFYYGNYDGQDKLPEFELHLGPNLWQSVTFQDASTLVNNELIHTPLRNYIHVCLVNTGSGVPFISTIEIRLLPNSTFEEQSLALVSRFDTGQVTPFMGYRYPDDSLDRFWYSYNDWDDWTQLSTSSPIDPTNYQIPSVVMRTAATPKKKTDSITDIWQPEDDDDNAEYYIYLHFAEVEKLQSNQSRQFNLTMDGENFAGYAPEYCKSEIYSNPQPLTRREINVSIIMAWNSTLPPILNAFEVYMVRDLSGSETNQEDFNTITNIKSTYKIEKNWQGDPCAPQKYSWEGLKCNYLENNEPPRIISLDLSWSGLTGEITPLISNLVMIQTLNLSNNNLRGSIPGLLSQMQNLRVLDISNNNLAGPIPDLLSQLPNLNVLNLEKNMLTGSVPEGLILKRNSGFLSLSLCENPNLSGNFSCKKKKRNFVIPIVGSVIGISIILLSVAVIYWCLKRKKEDGAAIYEKPHFGSLELEAKHRQFTHTEILKFTNNFERTLGKGAFGTVYHGYIDKTQVAVKMLSPSSVQGYQEFHAEVNLLMRVHHANLTSLVGYCIDETNMGLVYEYMANGNLLEHLSGLAS